MIRISATVRIALGLLLLVSSMLLVARTIGLGPDERRAVIAGRARLCENMALNASICATREGSKGINASLEAAVAHNPDILSAAIRRPDGQLLVQVGDHQSHWNLTSESRNIDSQMHVPIVAGSESWGSLEIRFRPHEKPGFAGLFGFHVD